MTGTWDWACLTGTVVLPDNVSYNIDRTNYNIRSTKSPSALVFCQSVEDVQHAVQCVLENHAPFRVRSGRHSYEEFSLMDEGLIIDVSNLTTTTIHAGTATARVGAGLTQQAMWTLLGADNVYAFPLGTMGSVGIAGVLP